MSPLFTPSSPLRVLVVDDSVDAADVLAMVLERKGCAVEAVHTGADALAAYERLRPHVVLMDLGLPDIDGATVARKLRARDTQSLLIAVSGFAEGSEQAGDSALFARHLLKPIDIDMLDEVLRSVRIELSA